MTYTGAAVSRTFMNRWRSRRHVADSAPWQQVLVRRGRFKRRFHNNWPSPQFGQIVGGSIRHQWYATWNPIDDWQAIDGVHQVDLKQSFDQNGIAVATIDIDNVAWEQATGQGGLVFHRKQRGVHWPWRGYTPAARPGSGQAKNDWYNYLPNAQIMVKQGYGPDTAVRTFTGLVDTLGESVRPDRITLSCRDFGGVLTDEYLFGWNKTHGVNDPISFVPPDYPRLEMVKGDGKTHRWFIVKDACDIVRICLRWAGFKEWEIENSGVTLSTITTFDKSHSYMDIINQVKEQLGYVFFIGEPTDDDSLGVPIFRRASVLVPRRAKPVASIRGEDLLTDHKPQLSNTDDRYIIRVRGAVNQKVGRYLDYPGNGGDASSDIYKRVTFQYWPPWMPRMAGVIKQLTYYNVGQPGILGFETVRDCMVACLLIAVQIGLARYTSTAQCPGQPAFGLDSFAYLTDQGTGSASRIYITNRHSVMALGGDGGSALSSSGYGGGGGASNELLWSTEIGGSLCDNPEMDHVIRDYQRAASGKTVWSWDSTE